MLPSPFNLLPASALSKQDLTKGTTLFRRNDPATAMFYVVSGQLELLRYTGQGDEVVIHRALFGETFAEAAVFSDIYHCDAVASETAVVVRISKESVLDEMRADSEFAMAISARFAGQIQNYRRRLEVLAIRDAKSRVFAALADGMLSGSIKSFAAQIGLTHEAVYRALSALTRSGRLVKTARGDFKLPK